jgi:hypothetical protein
MSAVRVLFVFLAFGWSTKTSWAEIIVPHGTWSAVINFEETVVDANRGRFAGKGIAASPGDGQLDSDSWMFAGFSDGDSVIGQNSSSGDLARGIHSGGVRSGGLYAFETSALNRVLGVQATGSDFSPGWIQLSIATSMAERLWELSFDWWVFNDKPRSTLLQTEISIDGILFTALPAAEWTTPLLPSASPLWRRHSRLIGFDFDAATTNLWVRWKVSDFAGSGSRDEFGIDNIRIHVGAVPVTVPTPEPTSGGMLTSLIVAVVAYRYVLATFRNRCR